MTTPPAIARDVTNDFSLVVATANGTGSQTANLTLLRACFHMGIPVCGKNIFPSNIQGLPTWYHIRVSKDGYVARRASEVLVAFNQATVDADLRELPSGGVALVDEGLAHGVERDDVHLYTIPVKALMAASEHKGKLRDYLANMTYVGVLAHLLDIPLESIEAGLDAQFGGKRRSSTPTWRWCAARTRGPSNS
jgi:2-oxoglutarate/2-oxoacid ferredoxin oxidoreductase subunit alpha